jgi:hypothetical protein
MAGKSRRLVSSPVLQYHARPLLWCQPVIIQPSPRLFYMPFSEYMLIDDRRYCDKCALIAGQRAQQQIATKVMSRLQPTGLLASVPHLPLTICHYVTPSSKLFRNECRCGLSYFQLIASYPRTMWIPTPPGISFNSVTFQHVVSAWRNTAMFRECMSCDKHVPWNAVSRKMPDSIDWLPVRP